MITAVWTCRSRLWPYYIALATFVVTALLPPATSSTRHPYLLLNQISLWFQDPVRASRQLVISPSGSLNQAFDSADTAAHHDVLMSSSCPWRFDDVIGPRSSYSSFGFLSPSIHSTRTQHYNLNPIQSNLVLQIHRIPLVQRPKHKQPPNRRTLSGSPARRTRQHRFERSGIA